MGMNVSWQVNPGLEQSNDGTYAWAGQKWHKNNLAQKMSAKVHAGMSSLYCTAHIIYSVVIATVSLYLLIIYYDNTQIIFQNLYSLKPSDLNIMGHYMH